MHCRHSGSCTNRKLHSYHRSSTTVVKTVVFLKSFRASGSLYFPFSWQPLNCFDLSSQPDNSRPEHFFTLRLVFILHHWQSSWKKPFFGTPICMHIRVCMYTCACMYLYVHASRCARVYVCLCVCVFVRVCVRAACKCECARRCV